MDGFGWRVLFVSVGAVGILFATGVVALLPRTA